MTSFRLASRIGRSCARAASTATTWRPVTALRDDSLETFQRHAFDCHMPAQWHKGSFPDLPAVYKWFCNIPPSFNYAYLDQFGDTLVPLEFTRGHSTSTPNKRAQVEFHRGEAPLRIFLEWTRFASPEISDRFYIAQAPISKLPLELQDDLPLPELVTKAGKGDVYDSSIWLGVSPTYTPLHQDPNPNIYFQLAGQKTVRLVAPPTGDAIFRNLQVALGESRSAHFRGVEMMEGQERSLLEAEIWSNTENRDSGFPGLEAVLGAGDSLFIPQGWWHSVKSTTEGITASVGSTISSIISFVSN
ncbi:MAG: hypothetical protein Q9214_000207 [Letrouitia sp. 1 TL-2023]